MKRYAREARRGLEERAGDVPHALTGFRVAQRLAALMRHLTVIAAVALVVGALLGLGELATRPARTSPAPPATPAPPPHNRSSGASDYMLSRTRTIFVAYTNGLAVVLVVGGSLPLAVSRR